MAQVTYQGRSDKRILTAHDVKVGLGYEGDFSKTEFVKGEAVEVPQDLAELLKTHSALTGQFTDAPEASAEVQTAADSTGSTPEGTSGTAGDNASSSTATSTSGSRRTRS